jgi:hypothetical protein
MRTRVNVPRSAAVLALCAAAAVATPSCRLAQRGSPATLEMRAVSTGTGLAVAARFAIPGDDLPKYLLETMPDSGIVPVRIAVRNEGTSPLLIHSANGMKLAPGFEGCSLVDDGRVRAPLPPRTVAERVLGKGAGRYRMRGATSFVAGSFIAPIEAFYIYSEIDVGRYYRPIFGKSFYPAFESGMMKPVRIEPGEERSGYLYFAMPGGAKPDSCELLVRACLPQETPRTLAGSGFVFSREERPSTRPARMRIPRGASSRRSARSRRSLRTFRTPERSPRAASISPERARCSSCDAARVRRSSPRSPFRARSAACSPPTAPRSS